jgi:hypothetical protein
MVAFDDHLLEILVPGSARIEAKLFVRSPKQRIPGAFDVIGAKGLAVMSFDTLVQPESQLGF